MDDAAGLKDRLTYPCGAPPQLGEAVEIAPGVLWLRLALPMALDHVNVFALDDGDGWVLVDTGIDDVPSREGWEAALAGPLRGRPVTRVLCTHMHPDHMGLAGWLCRRSGAPLLMSRQEYLTAAVLLADAGPAPEEGAAFYRAAGWDEQRIDRWRSAHGLFGRAVGPPPPSFLRLKEGDALTIGGEAWRVVIGAGHSPEHVCLWRAFDDVLIAGDQVLPKISSNVSVWLTEPQADPLGDWMESLDRLEALLPPGILALPGHGDPFRGVPARLRALRRGHEVSLQRLEKTLAEPRRAIDVFACLFGRPIGEGLIGMATGESLAHLHYLEHRGRARRERDEAGVDWWTAAQ